MPPLVRQPRAALAHGCRSPAARCRAVLLGTGRPLPLVKSSRRAHHLLDVLVAGPTTIATMVETGATALALDAHRTLLLDRDEMLAQANAAKVSILGCKPEE